MGDLKPGWTRVKFGEVVNHIAERAEPTTADNATYVGLEHLDSGSLTVRRWGSPTELVGTKLRMRQGDVLFARRNAYLRRVAIAPHDGLFSAHGMVLRPRGPHILPDFLPFFMQSDVFMDRAQKISVGSLSPTINWSALKEEAFALPPLEEQRRVATLLIAMVNLRATLAESIASARLVRESLVLRQFPATSTSNHPSITDVCTEITVGIVVKPAELYVERGRGIPALIMKNVQRGYLDTSELLNISAEGHAIHTKSRLRSGDVVAVRSSGSIGRTGDAAVVPPELDGANCIDLLILRPSSSVTPKYLCEFLNAPTTRAELIGRSSGTMQKHLNVGSLKRLRVPTPGPARQAEFLGVLAELDSAIVRLIQRQSVAFLQAASALRTVMEA